MAETDGGRWGQVGADAGNVDGRRWTSADEDGRGPTWGIPGCQRVAASRGVAACRPNSHLQELELFHPPAPGGLAGVSHADLVLPPLVGLHKDGALGQPAEGAAKVAATVEGGFCRRHGVDGGRVEGKTGGALFPSTADAAQRHDAITDIACEACLQAKPWAQPNFAQSETLQQWNACGQSC